MYQRIIVVGHVGQEPQMRYTSTGTPVTSFSLATNRRWSDANGQQQEKTTWFRVTCWRKLGETAAQYIHKGSMVLVEGEVEASAWIDRDGNARSSLDLTASNFRFVGGRGEGGEGGGAPRATAADEAPVHEDEIPF